MNRPSSSTMLHVGSGPVKVDCMRLRNDGALDRVTYALTLSSEDHEVTVFVKGAEAMGNLGAAIETAIKGTIRTPQGLPEWMRDGKEAK